MKASATIAERLINPVSFSDVGTHATGAGRTVTR